MFNTSSLMCVSCTSGTVYNSTTFTCSDVPKVTYMSNLKYGVPPYIAANKTSFMDKYI